MADPDVPASTAEFDAFFNAVYEELLRLARMKGLNRATPTLNSTALVSEVYMKLRSSARQEWREAEHVKAVAAIVMTQVLRTYLRRKSAHKRGGGLEHASLEGDPLAEKIPAEGEPEEEILLRLDLLDALASEAPRKVQIATMRLCGYDQLEIAEALDIGEATVKRDLAHLRRVLAMYAEVARSPSSK